MVLAASILLSLFFSLTGKVAADAWLHERVSILGTFAGLQYSLNKGVAFSVTFPSPMQEILIGIAMLLLTWAALHVKTTLGRIGFGMILGGALGNIIDRIGDGAVTDFFQVGTFPIFNVADSCITVGVVIAFLDAYLMRKKRVR